MNILNNFNNIFIIISFLGIMTNKINFISCQTCEYISKNIKFGIDSYAIEKEKGILLTESGYICDDTDPFSMIFRLNNDDLKMDTNISDLFLRSEEILRGTQKILDVYSEITSDAENINQFLKSASKCVPEQLRCPIEFFNITCNSEEKYRSFDGTCNNLKKPIQGAAFTPYSRLDETVTFYDDNVMEVRKSIVGQELTSPRIIIDKILVNTFNSKLCVSDTPNMGWLLFGQLITHDIAGSINNMHEKADKPNDPPIRCCSQDYKKILPNSKLHPGCLPFLISPDDNYHRNTQYGCHNYIRSKATLPNDCQLRGAQQISRVSHYLDLSVIYGSLIEVAEKLRTKNGGKLLTSDSNLLPKKPDCNNAFCYYTGDFRATQVPSLAIIHLLFIRLHNILAENIQKHLPDWDDEKIFQEARRYNIAIYQNIIYNDFLSILLNDTMNTDVDYSESIDGSTTNDFNTGVFRQLHWFTPKNILLFTNNGIKSIPYGEMILDETDYYETSFLPLMKNIMLQPINIGKIDDDIVNKLFNQTDLLSVDIQRGRDHGIAPYWKYREICGFKPLKSFKDLYPTISEDNIYRLARVYKSVRDIDLYIGGGLEEKDCGEIIGPTMKCLTKLQFERFKNGDRFFYTNTKFNHSLPENILESIKKISWNTIICATTNVKYAPKNAFFIPSDTNKLIDCSEYENDDFLRKLKI